MDPFKIYSLFSISTVIYCIYTSPFKSFDLNTLNEIRSDLILVFVSANFFIFSLLAITKIIVYIFFGELSRSELTKSRNLFFNFMFLKIILIRAVVFEIPEGIITWGMWLTVIILMRMICDLANERFKNLTTYTPNSTWTVHFKLITLYITLIFGDLIWFHIFIQEFSLLSVPQKIIHIYECVALFLHSMQGISKYTLYLYELSMKGTWDDRGFYSYYIEFFIHSLELLSSIGYFLTILILKGISLGIFELMVFLNLRSLIVNLKNKITAYKNYRKLTNEMDSTYKNMTTEELSQLNENCAICRDSLETAKKLPCGHMFHTNCLRSWLEYNHSCPSCRYELISAANPNETQQQQRQSPTQHNENNYAQNVNRNMNININVNHGQNMDHGWGINNFIHRWAPPFSVEINHRHVNVNDNFDFKESLDQVKEIYPNVPDRVIIEDLQMTRDFEQTVINLTEGFIRVPQNNEPSMTNEYSSDNHLDMSPPSITIEKSNTNQVDNFEHQHITTPPKFPDSFKSSPQERQESLQKRKMLMLEAARKKFIDSKEEKTNEETKIKKD